MPAPNPPLATQCPRCQQNNACGLAQGEQKCWCLTVKISPEALQGLSTHEQCLCPECASNASPCASTDS